MNGSSGSAFELLAPKGLALLGLLGPLVVLYILKIKRERRRVASTWLWQSAARDLLARSPFRRLVAEIPLILEGLAIVAFAVALARPATRGSGRTGDHLAIVIDTSASMSAAAKGDGGEKTTRIELAKLAADALVRAMPPGSDALVLEAGREARLASPLDRDRARVQAAIDALKARDVEGDLAAAVALAVDRMRQLGGTRRVVVFTDGALAHPLAPATLPIELVAVGGPIENAAIVRVDVRAGKDATSRAEEVQAFLLVANYGTKPRDLFVTMREDNQTDVLASRRVVVKPGERAPVVLTFEPALGDHGQGLVFDLSPHDAMPVDDEAFGRVPDGDRLPAFLAGAAPSPWLERALTSDPEVSLEKGTLDELAHASLATGSLVVVDGACPVDPPGGDLLIVHPPAGRCGRTTIGSALEHPVITSWESGDPRLRFLTLDGVHVMRSSALTPEGPTDVLVRTQSGPIVTDISTPARAGTLLGFDVGDSDWPLKASFVLFVRNVVEQARTHRAHGVTGPAHTGEPMRVSLPAGARELTATGPGGAKIDVALRAGVAVIADTPRAGLYHVAWQGEHPGSVVVPANLVSALESDVSPRPLPEVEKAIGGASVEATDTHTEWGFVFALVALALLVLDVAYLTRAPRLGSVLARPKAPERARP